MPQLRSDELITEINVRAFFQAAIEDALSHRQIVICEETTVYLINLLTTFIRSEELYIEDENGRSIKPLAMWYADAVAADSGYSRRRSLQRLGDVSLFISGLYAASLGRSLVDVDYYIAMGGNAYSYLAETNRSAQRVFFLRNVFAELAERFSDLVDVLSEVGESTRISNCHDVLRLYEIWLKTGSKRIAEKLQDMGIQPVKTYTGKH